MLTPEDYLEKALEYVEEAQRVATRGIELAGQNPSKFDLEALGHYSRLLRELVEFQDKANYAFFRES